MEVLTLGSLLQDRYCNRSEAIQVPLAPAEGQAEGAWLFQHATFSPETPLPGGFAATLCREKRTGQSGYAARSTPGDCISRRPTRRCAFEASRDKAPALHIDATARRIASAGRHRFVTKASCGRRPIPRLPRRHGQHPADQFQGKIKQQRAVIQQMPLFHPQAVAGDLAVGQARSLVPRRRMP